MVNSHRPWMIFATDNHLKKLDKECLCSRVQLPHYLLVCGKAKEHPIKYFSFAGFSDA